ncbi:MAG: hypothetical protein ABIP55_02850 [Tepidisphaeraceae bacterium]
MADDPRLKRRPDPPLQYADPAARSPGSGRTLSTWLLLVMVWIVGLVVWTIYLVAILYVLFKLL